MTGYIITEPRHISQVEYRAAAIVCPAQYAGERQARIECRAAGADYQGLQVGIGEKLALSRGAMDDVVPRSENENTNLSVLREPCLSSNFAPVKHKGVGS